MFYNSDILTKRGPLARVWMASHLNSKLTKSNLLATSIPSSVTSILGQDLLPMALRLSGQLLLGVARIYSRKAKYLLDDCQDTLGRVKKAFKPGQVDMQLTGEGRSKDAITLRAEQGGLEDILNYDTGNYWDLNVDLAPVAGPSNPKKNKANVSNLADITLPDHADAFLDDAGLGGFYGAEPLFDYGPDGALGDEPDFDLGLDLGLEDEDADRAPGAVRAGKRKASEALGSDDEGASVELGRDAPGSHAHASNRGSVGPFDFEGDVSMDKEAIGGDQLDLGGMDMGDFQFGAEDVFHDIGGGGGEDQDREKTPQPSSVNGDLQDESNVDLTPRTAADLAAKAAKEAKAAKAAGQPSKKKQVVDKVTEHEWDRDAVDARKGLLFVQPSYLPRSRTHLRLLERAADPTYYLPKLVDDRGDTYQFAPPGLVAPELQKLFTFPSRRAMIRAAGRTRPPEAGRDVELGRKRATTAELQWDQVDDVWGDIGGGGEEDQGLAAKFGDDGDLGGFEMPDMPQHQDDSFQFDVEPENSVKAGSEALTPKRKKQKVEAAQAAAAAFAEEEKEGLAVSEGPLAVFDDARAASNGNGSTQQHQTVTQSLGEEEEDVVLETGILPGKWSKNTLKAVNVLRAEFGPGEDDEEKEVEEKKNVEFFALAEGATRRAAASMFFELLVLSTRECIKVEQKNAFDDIRVSAKDKLWAGMVPSQSQSQAV